MGIIFINHREVWLPKSAFFAIADDILLFLKAKVDDNVYNQMVGSVNGIQQLDLEDIERNIIEPLFNMLKEMAKQYDSLKPYIDTMIDEEL